MNTLWIQGIIVFYINFQLHTKFQHDISTAETVHVGQTAAEQFKK